MQNLFECKVKYEKIDDKSGQPKKVSEAYLIDAVSFTEAETRIYKEMEALISGEFVVTNINKANYAEIFPNEDGDRWYKSKISFVSMDEKSGKEKKVSNQILVMANDVKDAFDKIHEGMNGMTVDFDINAISESPILDFFPYFKGELEEQGLPSHLKPLSKYEKELEEDLDEEIEADTDEPDFSDDEQDDLD